MSNRTPFTMSAGITNPNYKSDSVRYTPPNRIKQLQGQVDEVTDVMRNNIRLELERGGALDALEQKSDILNEGARSFSIRSKQLKKKYWWKNLRRFLFHRIHFTMSAGLTNPSYQSDSVRYTPSPRLQGLQNQVDEVTDVMRNNIGIALKRGEALDQLEQKAENLTSETERFSYRSKQLKKKYWWKNLRMWIILGIVVAIIIIIIIIAAVASGKKKT
ncbi:unnamed protein product [Adineta steineri]|uniref:V-SNARE coiled-coil homology domain-containing protein n=1 Tax=Adineta steineri TaxID=433720 RepID=A0A814X5W1_9BILA|nr:unnamed protein product [Adineta steineri]CAF1211381.1 unnamed protein product [Adineta steineri]CAF1212840.1 unnamed protein product [Adineta steineri]